MNRLVIGIILLNLFLFILFAFINSFPWVFIVVHIVSLIVLSLLIGKEAVSTLRIERKEIIFLVLLFTISFLFRIHRIETLTPGMQGDEVIVAYSVRELGSQFTPFTTSNFGHGTMIPYLVKGSILFFGDTMFAIRAPSILFGALGVVAIYLLCRYFFNKFISLAGAFLFSFSYMMISLSRVIYEPTASIFFEIFTLLFLFLALKTKKPIFFIGIGLFLGFGNYTYVNFRLFTIFIILALVIIGFFKKWRVKEMVTNIGFVLISTFIGMMPLVNYFIVHPDQLTARANILSIFNQHLRFDEIIANLWGNIMQLRYIFLFPGDPNFRINPGKNAMFDFITIIIFLIGAGFLIKKRLKLLLFMLFIAIPFLLSDVLAYESGPANTFYGFAHPNTMRVSGISPLVIIIATFGLYGLLKFISRNMNENGATKSAIKLTKTYGIIAILALCGLLNYGLYFGQSYDPYTNSVNGVTQLLIVKNINSLPENKLIYATATIKDDIRFQYFIKNGKKVLLFSPENAQEAKGIIGKADMVFIDSTFNLGILKEIIDNNTTGRTVMVHRVADGIDAFVFIADDQIAIDDFLPI